MVHFFGGSGNFDSCSAQPLFLIVASPDPPEAARGSGDRDSLVPGPGYEARDRDCASLYTAKATLVSFPDLQTTEV